jgi:hypothetical protein
MDRGDMESGHRAHENQRGAQALLWRAAGHPTQGHGHLLHEDVAEEYILKVIDVMRRDQWHTTGPIEE